MPAVVVRLTLIAKFSPHQSDRFWPAAVRFGQLQPTHCRRSQLVKADAHVECTGPRRGRCATKGYATVT